MAYPYYHSYTPYIPHQQHIISTSPQQSSSTFQEHSSYHSHQPQSQDTTPTTPSFPSFPWELFTPYYTHGSSSPNLYPNHGYSPHPPNPNPYLSYSSSPYFNNGFSPHSNYSYPSPISPQSYLYHTPPSILYPTPSPIPNPAYLVNKKLCWLSVKKDEQKHKKKMKKKKMSNITLKTISTFPFPAATPTLSSLPPNPLPEPPDRGSRNTHKTISTFSFLKQKPELLEFTPTPTPSSLLPNSVSVNPLYSENWQNPLPKPQTPSSNAVVCPYTQRLSRIHLQPKLKQIGSQTIASHFNREAKRFPRFGATKESLSEVSTAVFRIGTDVHLYDNPENVNIAPLRDSRFDFETTHTENSLISMNNSRYGDLVRIKYKIPDHVNRDDQQDLDDDEDVESELSLSPQIDLKKKKLLILNLNDYFRCIFIPSRVIDFRFLHTILFKRTFRVEVLKFCSQILEVEIWSSAVKKNVCDACVKRGYLVDKLLFIWAQFHCQKYEDEFKGFLNDCVVTLGSIVYGIVDRVTYMEHLADQHGQAILMKFDQLLALDFKGNIPIACSKVQVADKLVDCFKMDDLGLLPEEDPHESLNITDGESKEKGNVNAKSIEKLKPIVPPSNGGTRQPLERTSTSTNVLEKSHVISKIEDSELNEFYDEIVQDMEETLLESRDSSAARFSMGTRMLDPLLSMSSRDGGWTVSTSSADDAYLLFQRPRRIDMIAVVGARQKTRDVSFSERLVEAGCVSLARHIINSKLYGANLIVPINRFSTDTAAELNDSKCNGKLVVLQNDLVNIKVIEDDPRYWEVMSSALSVGWLDIVVKMLRLHGSYQLDQLSHRELENGLVEVVAVLISIMLRLRHESCMIVPFKQWDPGVILEP